jgi:GT2 family glycosyltransferase
MPRFAAPENDYRPLASIDPGPARLRAAVVIPVYNRAGLLQRTLAGLAAQRGYPRDLIEVVVVDDGSQEDVAAAVSKAPAGLPLSLHRQERDGYGAGRARTLGAQRTSADVVIFLDADCLPDPGLVAAHMAWHHRDPDLVVIGARHDLDTGHLDTEALASGSVDLARLAGAIHDDPGDWRATLYRRTVGLVHGTEAYRAVVSNNMSLHRSTFLDVDGFSPEFRHWGGEDTELAWRLWHSGALVVPETGAIVYHQVQEDGASGWREADRAQNDRLLADLVPHHFYRKDMITGRHRVPKISWVIAPSAGHRAAELLGQLAAQRVADWEAWFPLDATPAGDDRICTLPDGAGDEARRFLRAVAAARGQYVAVLSGAAAPDPLLADRVARALDRVQRASLATVGMHCTDRAAADLAWGAWGMPCFSLSRRREWSKVLGDVADPEEAWRRVRMLSWGIEIPEPLVTVPDPAPTIPKTVLPMVSARTRAAEGARTGGSLRRLVYRIARSLLRRRRSDPSGLPVIAHFGDADSLAAITAAAPWARVVDGGDRADAIVVGGGAVLDEALAEQVRILDTPRIERVITGARGASPACRDLVVSCAAVGLASDEDVAVVRAWGVAARRTAHPCDDESGVAAILADLRKGMT